MTDGCRVDMHVKVLDERVAARAKTRGIDVLVYAPHFTRLPQIRERAATFSDDELLVVPAREVFTGPWHDRKHVLALGLSEPVPDFITLDGAIAEFERQDATVLVPHPDFLTVSLDEADIRVYDGWIHGIEAYNPKHLEIHNERAHDIAKRVGKPVFASSYAHLRGTVGEAWTAFDESLDSEAALLDALRTGAPRRIEHRSGVRHEFHCKAELAHLAWENTWQKIDRILLSGTEPTNPRHIAYDGRFDDLSVY